MATSGSSYSHILQDITNQKLGELAKKRKTFEDSRRKIIDEAQNGQDPIQSLCGMVDGIKSCFGLVPDACLIKIGGTKHRSLEIDVNNLDRFPKQAHVDPSISSSILQ